MRRIARHPLSLLGILAAALLASALISLTRGTTEITVPRILLAFLDPGQTSADSVIIWSIRLPRLIIAILVGTSLALAGAALQGLFRNPLADPGLIGVSAGGALGAVFAIVLGVHLLSSTHATIWLLPACAFIGAIGVTLLIYRLARTDGRTEVATMLLAGIAVNAFAAALVGAIIFTARDDQIRSFTFWSLGSLAHGTWPLIGVALLFMLPAFIVLPMLGRALNVFLLGEGEAYQLGYQPDRLKRAVIILAAGAAGASVALSGIIGFVGLVVPHIVRVVIGPDHRIVLPASALLGATIVIWADVAARSLMAPLEMPVGILTALIGAPFFLFLLLRAKRP